MSTGGHSHPADHHRHRHHPTGSSPPPTTPPSTTPPPTTPAPPQLPLSPQKAHVLAEQCKHYADELEALAAQGHTPPFDKGLLKSEAEEWKTVSQAIRKTTLIGA